MKIFVKGILLYLGEECKITRPNSVGTFMCRTKFKSFNVLFESSLIYFTLYNKFKFLYYSGEKLFKVLVAEELLMSSRT